LNLNLNLNLNLPLPPFSAPASLHLAPAKACDKLRPLMSTTELTSPIFVSYKPNFTEKGLCA